MLWCKEISEGAHVGTTTHQGAPGATSAPRWVVPTWCTPSDVICKKNIQKKIILNFQSILTTFIFGSYFYCMGNSENRQNMAFYFI